MSTESRKEKPSLLKLEQQMLAAGATVKRVNLQAIPQSVPTTQTAPSISSPQARQKPPKYRNKKCVVASDGRIHPWSKDYPVQGIRFDSRKEAKRWLELRALEKAGKIQWLQRQHRIRVYVNNIKVTTYVADFVYIQNGKRVVEDVKSKITANNPLYKLKRRLVKAAYGIEIQEV